MTTRVKGQEVRVTWTAPGGTVGSLQNVQSFDLELQLEILSEGYLGETTEQKDDIFKGVRGRMEVHLSDPRFFDFARMMKERSQRRLPGAVFTATGVFEFPDGTRKRALIENAFFGPLPINTAGRDEYVAATIEFEAGDVRFF